MDIILTILGSAEMQTALIAGLGVVLTVLINRGAAMLEVATGIRIEQGARDALHSAIKSGIEAALANGPEAGFDEVKRQALAYAHHSVPDAITALVPGDGVLDQLALRYYREALARVAPQGPSGAGDS